MPSGRVRLGVALLLDEPLRSEVDGLRRALGDPSLGRMDPHITLVPPVNVRSGELGDALARLRSAAEAQAGPLLATVGPPGTFLPDNPVIFLEVGGDLERLAQLRDSVFQPPLDRNLSWPWVPHVTIGDGIPEERVRRGVEVLAGFGVATSFDRVVVLEERAGRIWVPIADACLEPAAMVGTGGLAVRITRGRILDPEVRALLGWDQPPGPVGSGDPKESGVGRRAVFSVPIVLTARRAGEVAGAAAAWVDDAGAHVAVFVEESHRRQGVGGHLLAHLESAAIAAGWEFEALDAEGPPGFYESRSGWARPASAGFTRTRRRSTGPAS